MHLKHFSSLNAYNLLRNTQKNDAHPLQFDQILSSPLLGDLAKSLMKTSLFSIAELIINFSETNFQI